MEKKHGWNQKGFTLVEVMAAVVILMLASQMIIAGTAVAIRMGKHAEKTKMAVYEMKRNLLEKEDCVTGTVTMEFEDGTVITRDGWMYRYEDEQGENLSANVFIVEDDKSWSAAED